LGWGRVDLLLRDFARRENRLDFLLLVRYIVQPAILGQGLLLFRGIAERTLNLGQAKPANLIVRIHRDRSLGMRKRFGWLVLFEEHGSQT